MVPVPQDSTSPEDVLNVSICKSSSRTRQGRCDSCVSNMKPLVTAQTAAKFVASWQSCTGEASYQYKIIQMSEIAVLLL